MNGPFSESVNQSVVLLNAGLARESLTFLLLEFVAPMPLSHIDMKMFISIDNISHTTNVRHKLVCCLLLLFCLKCV